MSIQDGTGLIEWEGGLFEPGSDLLRRVQWAFAAIRSGPAGGTIELNEAGRPFGVPADQNARSASATASGRSTVWYQWGRYKRGETPSAANPALGPNASEHTTGKAIDCNAPSARDAALRAHFFALAGLEATVASESWHWAIRGPFRGGALPAATSSTPLTPNAPTVVALTIREDDDDMPAPTYTKGDVDPAVYAAYQNAGDGNSATGSQGGVYFARRRVEPGEWSVVSAFLKQTGHFPNSDQKELVVIAQAEFDNIPKIKGSL